MGMGQSNDATDIWMVEPLGEQDYLFEILHTELRSAS